MLRLSKRLRCFPERVQSLINVAAFSQHLRHVPDVSKFYATSESLFVR